ncbi:Argininosuccinate lyase (plasmid) [Variovorax sp. SRS16]|uniref:tripartite tricarboxylate transporter substrate binding protein n=1 Tax=Variovorax sp. SRS16 TaxID=282217 RepID=UPI001317673E|nr:tripartite tricarboxylate transporter substrate binding protein [Variovorax sp. SRS16]VTU46329.1 Argininosuccinate lyase [Variovorax sp. SRS16]
MNDSIRPSLRRRALVGSLVLGGGLLAGAQSATAQVYPDKPIHMVIPFPAGGALDILGRLIGERLALQLKQPVLVENRAGAGGNVGAEYVARAAPDGYTILLGSNPLATTALYPGLNFDVLKDFAPVAYIGYAPLILVVPENSPARSLKDILDAARSDPSKVSFASAGAGSSGHMAAELLKSVANVSMLHVPYRGGAPALVDLIAGRVSFMLLDPPQSLPHIKAGRLRAIMVGSPTRFALLPEVQTAAEAGYPNLQAVVWWGFVAPAKTPREVVLRLNAEIQKALADPAVRARLAELGVSSEPKTPEQFGDYVKTETLKWNGLIKKAGLRAE